MSQAAIRVVLAVLALAGCSASTQSQSTDSKASGNSPGSTVDPIVIATTVAPITSIVSAVVGGLADVGGIVPEGTNSHTFEPRPSDAERLSGADLVFVNGLGLEEPTIDLARANAKAGSGIVELGTDAITRDQWIFDFSFPEDSGHPNPHLWTNPPLVKRYAELVRDEVTERDPANAMAYRENTDRYLATIDRLDAAIRTATASIPSERRKLLTYHDSWAYFAPVYGMTVVGAIQPADFAEPSARDVA